MPKGRRPPAMPNQTPAWVVDELLAEAVVRPTLGARRYADAMSRRGFQISASGAQKVLGRHGLGRRRQRVAALAQLTAATTGLLSDDARDGPFGFCHFAARPGDLVALDSFYIGNLKGVGKVWQLTAVDTATRWAICQVFLGPSNTDIANRFLDLVIRKAPPPRRPGQRRAHRQRSRVQRSFRRPPRDPRDHAPPDPAPVPEPQRGLRTVPRHRPPRVLATGVPPTTLRTPRPTPRRDRHLARRLQHPTTPITATSWPDAHPAKSSTNTTTSKHHDHDQQGPSVTSTRGPEGLAHSAAKPQSCSGTVASCAVWSSPWSSLWSPPWSSGMLL